MRNAHFATEKSVSYFVNMCLFCAEGVGYSVAFHVPFLSTGEELGKKINK